MRKEALRKILAEISHGNAKVCSECKASGKGKPFLLEPIEVNPAIVLRAGMIRLSPIRQVAMLLDEARKRGDIISFGGGAPSVPPAKEVVDYMCDQDVEKCGGLEYAPKKQIIVTDGGTEAIFSALMAILNKNDEVIITDPTYLGYSESVKLAGGRIKTLPVTVEKDYQPNVEDLKRIISNRTKAFILLSPDNPTGRVIDKEFAKGLIDLATDQDFWVISDDTYKHIIYEGEHIWISRLPGAYERTTLLCSFSKEASILGLRLGYALGPTEVIEDVPSIRRAQLPHPQPRWDRPVGCSLIEVFVG